VVYGDDFIPRTSKEIQIQDSYKEKENIILHKETG
jgi:hypothetical protein